VIFNKINSWLHDNIETKNPRDQQNNNRRLPRGMLLPVWPPPNLPTSSPPILHSPRPTFLPHHTRLGEFRLRILGTHSYPQADGVSTSESQSCRVNVNTECCRRSNCPSNGASVRPSGAVSWLVYSVQKSFRQVDKSSFGTWVTWVGPETRDSRLEAGGSRPEAAAFGIGSLLSSARHPVDCRFLWPFGLFEHLEYLKS